MNTTVESLKALYVSLGGAESDVSEITTIPEMIDAISLIIEGQSEEERTITTEEINAIINGIS